jgi:sugar-specific transcriptional regulator TrmB
MLEENLKTLGLTPNETKVYLAILQFGKLTHPAIAKITKIKRTTVYNIVGTLLEKNLIAEDLAGAAAQLSIRPIEVFSYIVRKEEQATEKKKRAVAELLPQLQNLSGLSTKKGSIFFQSIWITVSTHEISKSISETSPKHTHEGCKRKN